MFPYFIPPTNQDVMSLLSLQGLMAYTNLWNIPNYVAPQCPQLSFGNFDQNQTQILALQRSLQLRQQMLLQNIVQTQLTPVKTNQISTPIPSIVVTDEAQSQVIQPPFKYSYCLFPGKFNFAKSDETVGSFKPPAKVLDKKEYESLRADFVGNGFNDVTFEEEPPVPVVQVDNNSIDDRNSTFETLESKVSSEFDELIDMELNTSLKRRSMVLAKPNNSLKKSGRSNEWRNVKTVSKNYNFLRT